MESKKETITKQNEITYGRKFCLFLAKYNYSLIHSPQFVFKQAVKEKQVKLVKAILQALSELIYEYILKDYLVVSYYLTIIGKKEL